jgi:hypothetical protein
MVCPGKGEVDPATPLCRRPRTRGTLSRHQTRTNWMWKRSHYQSFFFDVPFAPNVSTTLGLLVRIVG